MNEDIKPSKAKEALAQAREEINDEDLKKAVKLYKDKLRELNEAKIIVANVEREMKELELQIEHGNL